MPREFEQSDEIKQIAKRLIGEHHPHLKPAEIAYVMKKIEPGKQAKPPAKRKGKKAIIASARKVPDLYRILCPYDFVLDVNEEFWSFMDEAQREALVDHELCHCMHDDDGWYIRDHDVEEFQAVIERRGLWQKELEDFVAAARADQKSLPFEANGSEMRVH